MHSGEHGRRMERGGEVQSRSGCRRSRTKKEPDSSVEPNEITFSAKDIDVTEWKGDILAMGVTEKDLTRDAKSGFENLVLNKIDSKLGGLLAEASSEEDFSGKASQSTVLRIAGLGSNRVGLIGLGQSPSTIALFRGLGEAVVAAAKSTQASNISHKLSVLKHLKKFHDRPPSSDNHRNGNHLRHAGNKTRGQSFFFLAERVKRPNLVLVLLFLHYQMMPLIP